MANLGAIETEIAKGIPNERHRLDAALKNLHYYTGRFAGYFARPPGFAADSDRWMRHSRFAYRIIQVLTWNLYKAGPSRRLPEWEAASEWLEEVYRVNHINALFRAADRWSMLSEVAAFQVRLTADPRRPIEILLWDASQFTVWCEDEDPAKPFAVATIDKYDETRRLRLYTKDEISTWKTEKWELPGTAGATAFTLIDRVPNALGRLPFSFVHYELPVGDFWTSSPGDTLVEANDYLLGFLTDHGDAVRYNLRPVLTGTNVSPSWRPRSPIKPGDYWDVPGMRDAAGLSPDPRLEYLQSDPAWITAGWDDVQHYIDHVKQNFGVPDAAFRMETMQLQSGIGQVAEQIPLILWSEGRQPEFGIYEADLTELVLYAGSVHLGYNDYANAAELAAAAADPNLQLKWPDMYPRLPGPERDVSDQWELDNGLRSRIELLMERRNLTREEAEAELKQIAKDRELEMKLLAPTEPPEENAKTDEDNSALESKEEDDDDPEEDTDEE